MKARVTYTIGLMTETKELTFVKGANGRWECRFENTAEKSIVQIERTATGKLVVFGNIQGMPPAIIQEYISYNRKNMIFELSVPAGISIAICSETEVVSAKIMQ